MNKDTIKGVLQRYIPPLSPDLVEKISEDIFVEINRQPPTVPSTKKRKSQSQSVTASSKGRTSRKRK